MEDGHVEPTGWNVTLVTRQREIGFRFDQGGNDRGTTFEVRVGARDFWKVIAAMSAAKRAGVANFIENTGTPTCHGLKLKREERKVHRQIGRRA